MSDTLLAPLHVRAPFPPWFFPSVLISGALTCLPKHRLARIAIGVPLFACLLSQAPKYTTGEVALDFVAGSFLVSAVIKWLDFAVFHDPDKDFWRVPDLRAPWGTQPEAKPATVRIEAIKSFSDDKLSVQIVARARNGTDSDSSSTASDDGHRVSSADEKQSGKTTEKEATVHGTPVLVKPATIATEPDHPRADRGFWERLRWSLSLWCTTRGVGWNWKVGSVPAAVPPGYPRLRFLRQSLHRFLYAYLANDFTHACLRWYASSKPRGTLPSLHDEPLGIRMAVTWITAFDTYHGLQFPYYLFATLTVATFICGPEQWPDLMGKFSKDMWSVRQFWGRCWHQQMRRMLTTPTSAISKFLNLRKGTKLKRYTELFISFGISAIPHHAAAWMVGRTSGGMYKLWLGQAAFIMFEDGIFELGRRAGIRDTPLLRQLGKLWVVLWFSLPTNVVAGAAVVINQGMGFDPPPFGLSTSALFPIASSADTLFKVMLERGTIFWMLSKALGILEANTMEGIMEAALGAGGAFCIRSLYYTC